ncbi:TetR/AcrR family transcriptional regulator [Stenotrophomonas maltophilia]|nr:TetR/AcrR family transcriptional regulator [Stenotrophomonas maltophilia]
MSSSSHRGGRRHRYLPGAERKREILDAALIEFLAHGFTKTTVEGIAIRAGMSKSGVYAHFGSKNQVFEELLMAALPTTEDSFSVFLSEANGSIQEIAEAYIDKLYARLDSPLAVPTFQLLIAESKRVPGLIERWHANILLKMRASSQALVDECVRRGVIRQSALTEHFEIVLCPVVYWLAKCVLLGERAEETGLSLKKMHELHKKLFLELLLPR